MLLEQIEAQSVRYWLARHVYVAALDGGGVLLDLRRDRYFAISAESMDALATIVAGWPMCTAAHAQGDGLRQQELEALAENFIMEGLLTRDPKSGKPATPVRVTEAHTLIDLGRGMRRRRRIRLRDMACFGYAYLATWQMRRQPLLEAITRLDSRKQTAATATFDERTAAELVDVFRRLRPYFLSLSDKCLEHAFLLVNFLACYGVFPQLVIGVKGPAFAAHSWVQAGQFVLDATPEDICFYTPILAI